MKEGQKMSHPVTLITGSTIPHSVKNSRWNRLWTCHKSDKRMMMNQSLITHSKKTPVIYPGAHHEGVCGS